MPDEKLQDGLDVTAEDIEGPIVDRRTTVKLLSATGLGGMAGLAGCAGGGGGGETTAGGGGGEGDGETTEGSQIQTGGRMSAGWNVAEFTQIDPHYSGLTFSTQLIGNFFAGLTEIRKDFTVQGDLAKDWTISNGGKKITFDLVENAHFHNGNNVLAEDVEFSIRRVIEEETPHANKFASLKALDNNGVVVEDDYRVTLNFKQPFAPILIYLTPDLGNAGAVVSPKALKEMGRDQFKITPRGAGPFKITEHELGSTLKTDAHDGYHKTDENGNQLPYLDGIDFEPLKEPTTRVTAIRTGDVQFLNWPPDAQANKIKSSSEVVLESRTGPNFGGLAFNTQAEPFTDKKVRLAVSKAIDEERYVKQALLGWGMADTGVYSPAHGWVYRGEFADKDNDKIGGPKKSPIQRYAPEEARQLAEEAGVMGIDIKMTVGQPELRGAKVLRQMLKEELNWNVEIEQLDIPTIFERLPKGNYKFIPFGNSVSPDPDNLTYTIWGPPESTYNWWGPYVNEDLMELLKKQRHQLDQEERKKTLWKIEDMLLQEAPWSFFEHETVEAARRTNVKNYTHYGVVDRLREVWLSE